MTATTTRPKSEQIERDFGLLEGPVPIAKVAGVTP